MRYLDSSRRELSETLYAWLSATIPDAMLFACQSGYFAADGITPFEDELKKLLGRGGRVHFVVGSNEGGLAAADLAVLVQLVEPYPTQGSVTVVGASDVLMHSKTYYAETKDGVRHGFVGSANLTARGLGGNVEAALTVRSDEDPDAPLDAIRDGILGWQSAGRPNAIQVTAASLSGLVASGGADLESVPRPPSSPEKSALRGSLFPPLGRIAGVRRTRRSVRSGSQPAGKSSGTTLALPGGAVGIVKRLSDFDTKAFRGLAGTPYVSMPVELAACLPMTPQGANDEPRLDLALVARLSSAMDRMVIYDGNGSPNITHVGAGTRRRSHLDLRFNYLKPTVTGLIGVAEQVGSAVPGAGDLAAIELVVAGTVRVTFATSGTLRDDLLKLLEDGAVWAWLPPGRVPPWA